MRDVELKEVVTVAEMARMCHLSRSRFYGLIAGGIMPPPSRLPSNRPYYSREQQEQCLRVRRTNCGINGQPVLFSVCAPRLDRLNSPASKAAKAGERPSKRAVGDPQMDEVIHGLQQLGMGEVTAQGVRAILAELYPDGYGGVPIPNLIASVFRHLKR